MRDTDDQIRSGLERLVDPGPTDHARVWDDLVGRRRRRQRRRVAAATFPVVLLVGIIAAAFSTFDRGDERSDVAAGDGHESRDDDDAVFELSDRMFNGDLVEIGGEPRPLAPETTISLSFPVDQASGTQRISWNAGCNNWGATLLETEPALQLGKVGSTYALCTQEGVAEQEHWLRDFFVGGPTWTLNGDTLTLTNGETVIELTAQAEHAGDESDAALSGRTFAGTTVEEGGESRPLAPDTTITVSFPVDPVSGDQHISWMAGCNRGGGPLVETEPALRLEDFRSTLIGCPDQLAAQDRWLGDFFGSEPTWSLADDVLTLTSGETVMILTAQD